MGGSVDLNEFVTGFILEAEEYLDLINRDLVSFANAISENRAEPRSVRDLFRALHTIKGLAAMVGAEPIVAIAHEMEGCVRLAERAGGRLSESTLTLLVEGTRAIEDRVRQVAKEGVSNLTPAPTRLVSQLAIAQVEAAPAAKVASSSNSATPMPLNKINLPSDIESSLSASEREQVRQALSASRTVRLLEFRPSPENNAAGFNITSVRARLGELGTLIKVVPRTMASAPTGIAFLLILESEAPISEIAGALNSDESGSAVRTLKGPADLEPTTPAASEGAAASASETSAEATVDAPNEALPAFTFEEDRGSSDSSSIRVDIRRLDEALEHLSDLVVSRSKLVRSIHFLTESGADTRDLLAIAAETSRQLKRLRASITKARMVPLSELLRRLPLTVRGLVNGTAKSARVAVQVGHAEVDKSVADKLFPALIHLIRNAVDHGIETREERRQRGKAETASITIRCDEISATHLTLLVCDDGRGIDASRIGEKLGVAVAKTQQELLLQITKPGFSSLTTATHTSGRGMGLDIVRGTIESLGGSMHLETRLGQGTTFSLQVPVSITIIDVLTFVSGQQTFASPIAMIDEIIEVDPARVTLIPSPGGLQPRLIQRRGEAISFLSLGAVFDFYRKDARGSETLANAVPTRALIVKQSRGDSIAFGVDRVLTQQEVVVRPLEDTLVRAPGVTGATDLGDGCPTLIIDLLQLGTDLQFKRGEINA